MAIIKHETIKNPHFEGLFLAFTALYFDYFLAVNAARNAFGKLTAGKWDF